MIQKDVLDDALRIFHSRDIHDSLCVSICVCCGSNVVSDKKHYVPHRGIIIGIDGCDPGTLNEYRTKYGNVGNAGWDNCHGVTGEIPHLGIKYNAVIQDED